MELSQMACKIITTIDNRYGNKDTSEGGKDGTEEYLDIKQIKEICGLYEIKKNYNKKISLDDINFSSPEFQGQAEFQRGTANANTKNTMDILESEQFYKRYAFYIKTLYACLKLDVDIFDLSDDVLTLKNNYYMIKTLEKKKREIIEDNIKILKVYSKNILKKMDEKYEQYSVTAINKIKLVDKIMKSIKKLIENDVFEKTDNLSSLILPYFYVKAEFIERYA